MAKMRISPELKKLIEKYRCVKDTEGMSPAIELYAECIRLFHSIDISDCPYTNSLNAPLHDIQPEKTLTGAVKGVTVDQVEQLKKMALRSVTDRHKVQELTEENTRLRSQVPSMKKRLEEAQRQQRLEQENRRLRDENYYLQSELQEERSFTERLTDGIGRMLDFLEEHLPERLRPLLEKARELLPDPEIGQQQEQQQHQRGMGGMEL